MKYSLILLTAISGTWLLWSGHYSFSHPLVGGFGVASVLLVVWLSARADLLDAEGQPLALGSWLVTYGPWLGLEIVKANIDVMKRIVKPSMPISPTLFKVTALQRSDLGHVIYGNSITLTPGTITLDIQDGVLTVHALSKQGADDVLSNEMNRRVQALEQRSGAVKELL